MRLQLCAALLACTLGFGSLSAGDLTTAQVQQIVSAAMAAKPSDKAEPLTLSIDGKDIAFTVSRDAVGNVMARPVPGPDSASLAIGLVTIQMRSESNGLLVPVTLVVVGAKQTIVSYTISLNQDGTIAALHQPGSPVGGGGKGGAADKPSGGIGSYDEGGVGLVTTTTSTSGGTGHSGGGFAGNGLAGNQTSLPAGAGTGEVSRSVP